MADSCGEPIICRIDRLDYMLKQLEGIRGGATDEHGSFTVSTSEPSTPSSSSGTDGGASDFSPKSLQKHCRPMHSVVVEAVAKGTLIERLDQVEDRLLKLCRLVEADMDIAMDHKAGLDQMRMRDGRTVSQLPSKKKNKGLKRIVTKLLKG